jgi:hypothetical protein
MDTILHLEHQGKTARVSLQALPRRRPKPVIQQSTKVGAIAPYKLINGINAIIDPFQSKPLWISFTMLKVKRKNAVPM